MHQNKKKLPIGIDNFEKLRLNDFYYVDKTGLIKELLNNWGEVNLFTRPRRFGKSLNMSMLENFFSIEKNQDIFHGLKIAKETTICEEYMGKYPVISISLKSVNAASFESAFQLTAQIIAEAAEKVQFLMGSEQLTEYNRNEYQKLLEDMSEAELFGSLKKLTRLLSRHYDMPVILLIDEYDVPLAKAYENGYYEQMVFLIRNLFDQVLKGNENLKFAVLTGCMRISKESIFTGLNNLRVLSVSDVEFDEYFGFTDEEVQELLSYYRCTDKYHVIKEWYDGYRFGNVDVYCPWDVVCYCAKLREDKNAQPENYWINTSSNDVVRKFIQRAENNTVKREIEQLTEGEVIVKEIHPELTYQNMYQSMENIWSVLFTTGYLTQRDKRDGDCYKLAIPNKEIGAIFATQIMEYFKENIQKDGILLQRFCAALEQGDAMTVESCFEEYLKKTISIRDTYIKNGMKENFYHGILLGILGVKDQWIVESNKEMGEGYGDIVIETENGETGIIIEIKYARDGKLDFACERAIEQISVKKYDERFKENGIRKILKYGIACYKKQCKVQVER